MACSLESVVVCDGRWSRWVITEMEFMQQIKGCKTSIHGFHLLWSMRLNMDNCYHRKVRLLFCDFVKGERPLGHRAVAPLKRQSCA